MKGEEREMHDVLMADVANSRTNLTQKQTFQLLERKARGEPMRFVEIPMDSPLRPALHQYRALYPHPLPFDHPTEARIENDVAMRRIQHLCPNERCWFAVVLNKPWCVEELFLSGFPIDAPNQSGMTPLHLAAHLGHLACVEVLAEAGANLNARTPAEVTPLESAIAAGHHSIVVLLQSKGASVRKKRQLSGHRTVVDTCSLLIESRSRHT